MKAWWTARAPRERAVLGLGGAAALVLLYWALVWDPLLASRDALRVEVQRQSVQLAWMRPAVREAAARGPVSPPAADGRSLLARVDGDARAAGLGNNLVAVEPQGNGQVQVRLAAGRFEAVAGWLEQVAADGLGIEELSVSRAGSDRVEVRVVLREGQG